MSDSGGLQLVRHGGDEVALERVELLLLARREEQKRHARQDHQQRRAHVGPLDHAAASGARLQLRRLPRGDREAPLVERRGKPRRHQELPRRRERAPDHDAVVLVGDVEAPARERVVEELRQQLVADVVEVGLEHDVVAPPGGLARAVGEQHAAPVDGAVPVAVRARGLGGEVQLRQQPAGDPADELRAVVVLAVRHDPQRAHRLVEHEHRAHRRGDALREVGPALRQRVEVVGVDQVEHRVVAGDHRGLDAVDLLANEQHRALDDRALAQRRERRRGAPRPPREEAGRHHHRRQQEGPQQNPRSDRQHGGHPIPPRALAPAPRLGL